MCRNAGGVAAIGDEGSTGPGWRTVAMTAPRVSEREARDFRAIAAFVPRI
jgi:hypothetical protein